MKKKHIKSLLFCSLFSLFFCAPHNVNNENNKFSFIKSTKEPIELRTRKKIAILTFEDQRDKDNISYSQLHYLPFVPYAPSYFPMPENSYYYHLNFRPEVDLAEALTLELKDYSVFDKVIYTDRMYPKDVDYLVICKIMKDSIQRKETIFGTSAIYLIRPELGSFHYWLIATFPITFQIIETHYVSLGAELEIEVKDSKNRQTIFQKKFELKESNFRFIGDKLEVKEYKDFYKLNEKIIHEVGKEIITQFKRNQK